MLKSLCLLLLVFIGGVGHASELDSRPSQDGQRLFDGGRTLVVGVKVAPPFVTKLEDGTLGGVTISLWRTIASNLGISYRLRELRLPDLLAAVEAGTVDVAASALTVTADRERRMDFSHPFFNTGFGIAISNPVEQGTLTTVLGSLFSWAFLRALATLALVLLAAGSLVWFFERRGNPSQFGGKPLHGIGSGFWWSAVTMTTVGYGDKAPVTLGGRIVAIIWMFTGIITISTFTATITSALTTSTLHHDLVRGPADLSRARVGSIRSATSESYVQRRGIAAQSFDSATEALQALVDGSLDAVVHDAPVLRYLIRNRFAGSVTILPGRFERQEYAFAYPAGSPLREPINRALMEIRAGPQWNDILLDDLSPDDDGWTE